MNLYTCSKARLAAEILKSHAGRHRDCLVKLLQLRFADGVPDQDLLIWLDEQPPQQFSPI